MGLSEMHNQLNLIINWPEVYLNIYRVTLPCRAFYMLYAIATSLQFYKKYEPKHHTKGYMCVN